jgi:hypothetical protein
LYGCETWSFTAGKKHKLRVCKNKVLRKIYGPKREVGGDWRRLHNEELHNFYASPDVVRVMKSRKMIRVAHLSSMRNSYKNFGWQTGREETLGKHRRRWEDNIRMDLRTLGGIL